MQQWSQHLIVRLVVCVLLTWTAVDLLVPELCGAEEFAQGATADSSDAGPDRGEDCFCCSHVVAPVSFRAMVDAGPAAPDSRAVPLNPLSGVAPVPYHPPLVS